MEKEIYAVKIKKHTKEYKEAKETLKTAFPLKEQSPLWALRFLAKHDGVDFLCFYDKQDNYIGVSYSIHDKNNRMLLLYLAVAENARSKGYGSAIVHYLEEKDNIKETVLDIESPYEQADNQRQRIQRLSFYQRLGFRSSNYEIVEPACHYLILGKNTTIPAEGHNFHATGQYISTTPPEEAASSTASVEAFTSTAVKTYTQLTDQLTKGLCKLNIKEVTAC